jgi:hypothetical protein
MMTLTGAAGEGVGAAFLYTDADEERFSSSTRGGALNDPATGMLCAPAPEEEHASGERAVARTGGGAARTRRRPASDAYALRSSRRQRLGARGGGEAKTAGGASGSDVSDGLGLGD